MNLLSLSPPYQALSFLFATVFLFANGHFRLNAQSGDPAHPSSVVQITPPILAQSARFGESIAADGDRLAVGEPGGGTVGRVTVFRKDGGNWILEWSGQGTEPSGFGFGGSVAISGDVLVVGAPQETVDGVSLRGAVYIYRRQPNNTWNLERRIAGTGTRFGRSVGVDGDTVVATNHPTFDEGSALVFRRVGSDWIEEAVLRDSTGLFSNGFGINIDISGNTVVVGEKFGNSSPGVNGGAVCVFVRSGTNWQLQARIPASWPGNGRFGSSVSIFGDLLVVGAENDGLPATILHAGAAYVYTRENSSWTQRQKLTGFGPESTQFFGAAVDASSNRILVGAYNGEVGTSQPGSTFFYRLEGATWANGGRLIPPDTSATNIYGWSVAISGNRYFTSSPARSVDGFANAGTVDVFTEPPGIPDLNPESDSGVSSSDNITNAASLSFRVDGAVPGASVELFRNEELVATAVASNGSVSLVDPNPAPSSQPYRYTTRQLANGELSSRSDSLLVTVDRTGPSVTVNQFPFTDPTRSPTVAFSVQPSEASFGVDVADISLAGSTAELSQATVELETTTFPNPYTVTVSGIVSNGQFVRASVDAGRFTDSAGNLNSASTSNDNTITIDNVVPTATIDQATDQADPTNSLPIRFRVIFSEPVSGFSNSDISFAGSTANVSGRQVAISGTGPEYEISVSGISTNGGFVLATIPANLVADALGNSNIASTSTDNAVTVDNVRPSVTLNQAAEQADPTSVTPVRFSAVFNENVTGLEPADVSFAGSSVDTTSAVVSITGSGTNYAIEVTNFSGVGQLKVSLPLGAAVDATSNGNNASTSTDNAVRIIAPFASLSGRITSGRGIVLRGLMVTATLPDGSIRYAPANDFGNFSLRGLPTGRFILHVRKKRTVMLTRTIDLYEDVVSYDIVFF